MIKFKTTLMPDHGYLSGKPLISYRFINVYIIKIDYILLRNIIFHALFELTISIKLLFLFK